ncbi:hypothetical protein M1N59_00770 [Dehalococcoidales bacterium]|nr:hypothetical protein [Dehalococcoidales bacterium]
MPELLPRLAYSLSRSQAYPRYSYAQARYTSPSERLGHASVAITLDSHVLPGLQEAAAERFDMLLQSRQTEVEDVGKRLGARW